MGLLKIYIVPVLNHTKYGMEDDVTSEMHQN